MNDDLNSILDDISNHCQEIQSLRKELSIEKSISLLKLKNDIFLAYMKNLMFIILLRSQGLSIQDHPSVKRLVEYRVVLERIRPLEHKLKFQIDRAIKVATEDINEVNTEGLNARLMEMSENIDDDDNGDDNFSSEEEDMKGSGDDESDDENMNDSDVEQSDKEMAMSDDEEEAEEEDQNSEDEEAEEEDQNSEDEEIIEEANLDNDDDKEEDEDYIDSDTIDGTATEEPKQSKKQQQSSREKSSVYRPPKLNPAFYVDARDASRAQKEMQRSKARAMRSTLLEDLREEVEGNPKETFETSSLMNKIQLRKEKERQMYEEEYFTRLTLSKKDKAKQAKLIKGDPLDNIGNFEEIKTLFGDDEYPELQFRKNAKKPTKKQTKRLKKQKLKGKKKFKKTKRK